MATPWQDVFSELGGQLDAQVLPRLYDAARLTTAEIRLDLDQRGLHRFDPEQPALAPTAEQLLLSEAALISSATRRATVRGALAGFGGLLSVPPELALILVQLLHLTQRIAVIYGHDPESERGKLLLLRAMADGMEFELPQQLQLTVRVTELPALLRDNLPARTDSRTTQIARFVASRAVVSATRRVVRVVPGLGATVGALQARRALQQRADRIAAVLRGAWARRPQRPVGAEDAVELPLDRAPASR